MYLKRFALLGSLVLFPLAACEDPSGVGLSLVGETGGEPHVTVFPIDETPERELGALTGGTFAGGLTRVIAGRVDDPILGRIEATAHLDFQMVTGITDAFRGGTVSSAEVRLRRSYVYGDTTSVVQLQLHDMADEWDAVGLTADTLLNVGNPIAIADYLASDTTIVIPLPDHWVAANDTTLRSTFFNSVFHGFAFRPAGGNAATGFDMVSAVLRVVSASDTVDYAVHRGFTAAQREPQDGLPERVVVQDVAGPAIALHLNRVAWDTLGAVAVNQAVVRLRADTNAVALQSPPNFVRPQLTVLQLAGYRAGALAFTVNAEMNQNGEFVFRRPQDVPFFFQELLEHEDRELRIRVPGGMYTLNPVFLHATDAQEGQPVITLTLTSADH